jgi:hypothetical protein
MSVSVDTFEGPTEDYPVGDFSTPDGSTRDGEGMAVDLKAPKGMYRVVGVDTFEGPFADYLIGDYLDPDEAKKQAHEKAGEMNPCYVYDDAGVMIFEAGTL